MPYEWTRADKENFIQKNLTIDEVEKQLNNIVNGFPFLDLSAPAIPGDGIFQFNEKEQLDLINKFDRQSDQLFIEKFVPASGAASRMFKSLLEDPGSDSPVDIFFAELPRFPFYDELNSNAAAEGLNPKNKADYKDILSLLLSSEKMNWANQPKGLIPFHRYTDSVKTAFEEHLEESEAYIKGKSGKTKTHFTVQKAYGKKISEYLNSRISDPDIHKISFSSQSPETDTVAMTKDLQPLRDIDGNMIFRPGGHGALLKNLQHIESEIIFIKNIDNVARRENLPEIVSQKKVLGGILLTIRATVFKILRELDNSSPDMELVKTSFEELQRYFPNLKSEITDNEINKELLKNLIDRPIRVCGMVTNVGEPGGGPFWVKEKNGHLSLQVAEKNQIDLTDQNQLKIFEASTHFSPVDIVCTIKNWRGEKFDLNEFTDPETGIITVKNVENQEILALELPGLWNGGMAHWLTLFVEVPLHTFNPVKTVFDLLRPEHQPKH